MIVSRYRERKEGDELLPTKPAIAYSVGLASRGVVAAWSMTL